MITTDAFVAGALSGALSDLHMLVFGVYGDSVAILWSHREDAHVRTATVEE